ncbi:Arc family DNA-binding protein [Thermomonas carbonis]|uniref:Arc family DNA-binding protein n=1 Tax=Thermomonas carbonis TaxID=1463158 RepID=A0A7G9SPU0_9GAMM|nr:Arc family DNA-binding protein [Thermomonas carbonis]QNN69865.1 Arc family DNA-binding protein [Thermomonas carbonis]GHB95967.1 hypothetical protein GCM10010080_04660 [Thermomonas carbonis]
MARDDTQVNVRLPAELVDRLRHAATQSGKSLTSEIVDRLIESFPITIQDIALDTIRKEAELLSAHSFRLKFDPRANAPVGSKERDSYREEVGEVTARLRQLEREISERNRKFREEIAARKAKTSTD